MKKDHIMLIILLLRGPSLQENAMATDENAVDHRRNHLSSDDMELLEEDRVPKVRPTTAPKAPLFRREIPLQFSV
jgi:hypothetical protein